MQPDWLSLPDTIWAQIMSKVPHSKPKVGFQVVCKFFQTVLAHKEAHALRIELTATQITRISRNYWNNWIYLKLAEVVVPMYEHVPLPNKLGTLELSSCTGDNPIDTI